MKTFLSIGSGPGIGLATATRFAREGYRVILTSRNNVYLQEQVLALQSKGYQAEGRFADAANISSITALIHNVESATEGIDVLHFNSAALHDGGLDEQSIDGLLTDLNINIGAGFAAVKAVIPAMTSRRYGTILLTGGGFAITPVQDYLSLGIGKAGLRNMTRGLYEYCKSKNIHIATVTIGTFVAAGSQEASEIAEEFWLLHGQRPCDWSSEVPYPSVREVAVITR